jgi:hypothetical protein
VAAPSDADLARELTGLVVESLAVEQDVAASTVPCSTCGTALGVGDRVTAPLRCYEDHTWELQGVHCESHGVDSVAATMGVRAERQAVVAAVLEAAGYHSPDGSYHPDALTLGAVEALDVSSTAEGY